MNWSIEVNCWSITVSKRFVLVVKDFVWIFEFDTSTSEFYSDEQPITTKVIKIAALKNSFFIIL